ncbi:MAG: hypothetical protein ACT6SU_26675 [Variovorax sp.]|jgi:hypothetical protein
MAVLAGLCTVLGALCVYRAAPHQRLGGAVSRPRAWRGIGGVLVALGAWLFCRALQPAAGLFSALTLVMCAWIALPYVTALRRSPSEGRHGAR